MWNACLVCGAPIWACTHAQPNTIFPASALGDATLERVLASVTPAQHDAERYPHPCDECGGWRYVGAGTVEHEGECR